MRSHLILITALALAACPSMHTRAETLPASAIDARLEAAKTAEDRGDLARAREQFQLSAVWYNRALRNNRNSFQLYNKLGIVELKLRQNNDARKSFEDLNQIRGLAYRRTAGTQYGSSRIFLSEFSMLTAVEILNSVQRLIHSHNAEDQKLAKFLLKTAAIKMQSAMRGEPFRQPSMRYLSAKR